ncbi:MAG: GNAT family N-acetyltransferase [Verrucomicrobiaceae bacterium]|nr:MAG: GNAT family N-acetyltransferase [Verrucomicrobiaceae bacterium]
MHRSGQRVSDESRRPLQVGDPDAQNEGRSRLVSRIPNIIGTLRTYGMMQDAWPRRNEWLKQDDVAELYVRTTQRLIPALGGRAATLDMANFTVFPGYQRQGLMREMFDAAEEVVRHHHVAEIVYVENILNPEALINFLTRRGYVLAKPVGAEYELTSWFKRP